ncbi:MAG: DUF3341 domain-containing protein [Sulfurifustaceae bacterium]
MSAPGELYGVLAEFASADALIDAARRARSAGYARVEAYAPFPVEGLADALGFRANRVPLIVLVGGIAGAVGGYFMQWSSAVIAYAFNAGGRPLHSWPAFIPATFELAVLGAALAAFFGMLILNGLPKLYHPIFNAREFEFATRHRFFLCLRADDPAFDRTKTRRLLESLRPILIEEVMA